MPTATASPTSGPEGIGYADAAFKLAHLLRAMRARRLSGVRLKDDSDRLLIGGRN